MHGNTTEFVFRRRRKRLPISLEDAQTTISIDQVSDGVDAGMIPEIAALPEPTMSPPASPEPPEPHSPRGSSENIITVEKFLRRSVPMDPKTKHAVAGTALGNKSRAYTHQRQAERRKVPICRAIKASKRPGGTSRIVSTLLHASVLTGGDPRDTLVESAGIPPTRRPLKFVPFNKFASPVEIDQANSVEPSDGGEKDAVPRTRRLGDTSNIKAHHPRVPLRLVPFREAEAAYSDLFP